VPALLSAWQEALLWERIIEESPAARDLLRVDAAAALAAEAWSQAHAWAMPLESHEFDAAEDTSAFRAWSRQYVSECERLGVLETARLSRVVATADPVALRETVFFGFGELNRQQQDLAERRGIAVLLQESASPSSCALASVPDSDAEIEAAALWARAILGRNPSARIGIATAQLSARRTEVERVLTSVLEPSETGNPPFHIALGPPLSSRPVVNAALRLLESSSATMSLPAFGVVLQSPWIASAREERSARAQFDASLRRERVTDCTYGFAGSHPSCPSAFSRLLQAAEQCCAAWPRRQNPSAWARAFGLLLETFGWPGEIALSSVEFQTVEAFRSTLSELATLDMVRPELTASQAIELFRRITAESRFEPEDRGQPVQVLGLHEAAVESFDHLWIMGMDDESWPPPDSTNPFLPLSLQRACGVPRSSPASALESARRVTHRLLAAAPDVRVSYPCLDGERALEASPLIAHLPREQYLASEQRWYRVPANLETIVDGAAPPLAEGQRPSGGTRVLQMQAACPFRAFAEFRLFARELESPPLGLDARDRGVLLHEALKLCWIELQSQDRLRGTADTDLEEMVKRCVTLAIKRDSRPAGLPFQERVQKIEQRRLKALITRWLKLEQERPAPFHVLPPEQPRELIVGGLTFRARIDRIDQLPDGRLVIIDYKSSAPSPAAWDGDRPEEPQVPLYATSIRGRLAAVAFAQVQTGDSYFRGLGTDTTVLPGIKADALDETVGQWREVLERLAIEFRDGRAPVDPRVPGACAYCHLHSLCRIDETI
jgi:probable DNA repair protein